MDIKTLFFRTIGIVGVALIFAVVTYQSGVFSEQQQEPVAISDEIQIDVLMLDASSATVVFNTAPYSNPEHSPHRPYDFHCYVSTVKEQVRKTAMQFTSLEGFEEKLAAVFVQEWPICGIRFYNVTVARTDG